MKADLLRCKFRVFQPSIIMRMVGRTTFLLLFLLGSVAVLGQTPPQQPFAISTSKLPDGVVGEPYKAQLETEHGATPVGWTISSGHLPPGIVLDHNTGLISGTPTQPGTFTFGIAAHDGANASASRQYFINIETSTLKIAWKDYPVLGGGGIQGGVEVENPSQFEYDLTVIIVAVNEYGKAFALGYQHFPFRSGATEKIPFGMSLPQGQYVVHADAVGEVLSKKLIHRARLQTPKPLMVASGP